MQLREALLPTASRRMIDEVVEAVLHEPARLAELYVLFDDDEPKVAWKAVWACEKLCRRQADLLLPLRDELIGWVFRCEHSGMKRLLLSIVNELPLPDEWPVELLDYCLQTMLLPQEASANRALCMKLAYKFCRQQPDLLSELQICLENADPYYMTPAVRSTRKNILMLISKRMKQIKRNNYVQ